MGVNFPESILCDGRVHLTAFDVSLDISDYSTMALRYSATLLASGVRRQMSVQARAMSQMAFTFAAPNGVHYDAASVKQVDVPSFSGSFGILPNHVPALAVLKPGVVTVYEEDGEVKKFFVSSGSVTVNEDASVQILAEEAQSAVGAAADDAAKAEAQIAVEVAEEIVKA